MDESIWSIIPSDEISQWVILNNPHPLVKLHRWFWLEGAHRDDLVNVHEDEVADQNDEDESVEEDDDHGIRSGYVLDLGMAFGRSMVWVRKDYIRMYKCCTDHVEANCNQETTPSLVITGQPGIGKSNWILYAICRQLAQKKSTIWYRGEKVFLFVREGVFKAKSFSCTELLSRVWTLVDNDECSAVPSSLATYDTQCLIIFTSSPEAARWKGLSKTTDCVVVVMNPWSRREIANATPIHGLDVNNPRIDEMYNRFGPIPRVCFDYLRREAHLNEHRRRFETSLSELSARHFLEMVHAARNFQLDDVSHTIILVRRRGRLSQGLSTVEPITVAVEMEIRNQLKGETQAELYMLYRSLVNVEESRRIAGVLCGLLGPKFI